MSDRNPPLGTVVIVGGAGAMGRWAVRGIAKLGSARKLLIADIDVARAQQVADEVGGPCAPVHLDATDPAALRQTFADCDVVLNTMGPFSKFARPIVEAAVECGCDYLDIDDDWESTVEAFEFDAKAREKGLRVVKGIGGSPGISNLAAASAARRLDKVTEIFTGWSMRGAVLEDEPAYPPAGGAGAAVEHWLIQISGSIRAYRDGAEKDIEPLAPVELLYPGKGRVQAYTVGHPEAITLPRYFPTVVNSTNLTSGPVWVFDHARAVAADYDAGRVTLSEGASRLEHMPGPPEGVPRTRDPLHQVWAMVRGERDGEPLAVSVEPASMPPGKMGGGTGAALAVGLELLREGRITEPGVHAPEGVIEPQDFFSVFLEFVEPAVESVEDLLIIHEGPVS
ncbi:saccharopine dehydrogenase family protein [Amycolatopsis anabasis]|uniref:saccharopine dehydrogenase family protein n=1 Tax=Amycolatopsis anabasis TaxID=1840409 RepID=UPI00131E8D43|nr:saccharopine dehydrogenase NADP-binding domain-containing protein [Amycolatopsis anabasis]